MATDPITVTQDATNVGTDVSVGPGETMPDPRKNPGANPNNPGDDPGVATPQAQPDVLASGRPAPAAAPRTNHEKGAGGEAANDPA